MTNGNLHKFNLVKYVVIFIFINGCTSLPSKSLKIACASNMQYALDSIVEKFESKYNVTCEITSGASGLLYSQIVSGAPYDLFLSANMEYPNILHEHNKAEKPIVFAKGQLLFVTKKGQKYNSIREFLQNNDMNRIAIADTIIAPFGMATLDYLSQTKQQLLCENKLVIAENIGQVNLFLVTKSVDAGFTANSFRIKNKNKFNFFEINPKLYQPINQSIALLNKGSSDNSKQFIEFLSSTESKSILTYFGYLAE